MKPTITCQAFRPAVCTDRPTTVQLWVRLEPPKVVAKKKPALNLGLSIDRSGSMSGEPILRARQAATHLIRNLESTDKVSVVSFDDVIEILAPCDEVGRQFHIENRLATLEARGSTNLHQGWLEAGFQVERGSSEQQIDRVVLLSDGQANIGITDKSMICAQVKEWCQEKGISTTTVGLGLSYNEDLLAGMADAGNGNFYHIEDPSDIEALFQVELQGLSRTFGTGVKLGLEELAGVELLRVVNLLERDETGRLRTADLVHGSPIDLVFELHVPALAQAKDLCRLKLSWTNVETGELEECVESFRLPVVPHGQLEEFPVCQEVMQKRAVQLAARTLSEAVSHIDKGESKAAKRVLEEGLRTLKEAGSSPDLLDYAQQFQSLLTKLERGSVAAVRKGATSISRSVSIGSVSLISGPMKEFLALPTHERTQERLMELIERYSA